MSEDTKRELTLVQLRKTRDHYQRGADLMGELMSTLAKQHGRELLLGSGLNGQGGLHYCAACKRSFFSTGRTPHKVIEWDAELFHPYNCMVTK